MAINRNKYLPVTLAVVLTIMAIASEFVYFSDFEFRFRTRRFNKVLHEKERIMEDCLNGMKPILASGESHGSALEEDLFATAKQNGITVLEIFDNRLVYWSDNDFDVPSVVPDSLYAGEMIFIQNGWFLSKTVQSANEKIVGLLRLRTEYGFENDIIKNGFIKDFGIPDNVGFSRNKNTSKFHVYSNDGSFLFSLVYPEEKGNTFFILFPLLLWSLVFMFLLFITVGFVRKLVNQKRRKAAFFSCLIAFTSIYLFTLNGKFPVVIFQTELFSPYRYTMNAVIPSLGHLFILSILLSALSGIFYNYFSFSEKIRQNGIKNYLPLTLLLLPGALLFMLDHLIISHLIYNSNINFETFKVLELNVFSLIGFVSAGLLFSVPVLYFLKIFRDLQLPEKRTVIMSVLTHVAVYVIVFFTRIEILLPLSFFYFLIVTGIWFLGNRKEGIFTRTIIYSLLFALYSLFVVTYYSEKKTEENVKIQLVAYSTENDPYAEHLLLDMWPEISSDSLLAGMMDVEYFERTDYDNILDYLHDRYFNGYWGNFSLNLYLCTTDDSLKINDSDGIYDDCFSFFGNKILSNGNQLTGTGFYFIENKLGRSNYLGQIFFKNNHKVCGMFIDLYNDINVFQQGYSELLLDKKYHSYARLKDYSFAKYINGDIIISTGDYSYTKTDAEYLDKNTDYRSFRTDKYQHVLYKNRNVTVIISRPALTFLDLIISFAYLFAFIILFSSLILAFIRKPVFRSPFGFNFREKLQMSFIAILVISFTLIGIVVASFSIRQSRNKHYENVKEKLNSVYIELENRISSDPNVLTGLKNSDFSSLNGTLVRLSNIFNTDINLYNLPGYLIATSRSEIFYRNLTSRRMNDKAWSDLVILKRSECLQKEKIGNLEYISAYVPFYSEDNELVAYLNLPYFRMQSILAEEISNMIVAVINFTLLLIIIAMGLAVFISGRLTSPLAVLSSRLATVELGKKSEHLSYKGKDEVGELVRQYNRMVDELDASAKKLAATEREYAWREMAKQIAHEIKNPLTPMKLNVQQLYKSWKDAVPGFEKRFERFTKNQIEYIDNLSLIASAFSSYARIPEARPVEVDLLEQIKSTIELFKNSENVSLKAGWPHDRKILIFADKEHVNGIFSNLIKNGLQSIPQGREGIIKINFEIRNRKVVVSVTDNGTGIPELLQRKMFVPNFTTKSSGMGLGLSIVKRYVESASGRVWFESEPDKGSTFYVEFPLLTGADSQEKK